MPFTKQKLAVMVAAVFCLLILTLSTITAAPYVRPTPTQPIKAGPSTVLGSPVPVITVPLVAETHDAIVAEARNVASLKPDMVEVRSDYWNFMEDANKSYEMLKEVKQIIGDIPILLTCRISAEGGHKAVSDKAKFDFYDRAIKDKFVNFIDVEFAYGDDFIKSFKNKLQGSGISLVVSYHDFKATPAKEKIVAMMERQVAAGADVVKIVVKPNSEEDVLTFLGSTLAFRRSHPQYPIIASGSGDVGRITRLIGGLFGIDLTFASGVKGSNPTQMPASIVRESLGVIYPTK
jgi:3-dehydroquinate dehydratase-1